MIGACRKDATGQNAKKTVIQREKTIGQLLRRWLQDPEVGLRMLGIIRWQTYQGGQGPSKAVKQHSSV